jgi:hypothetical protein
MDNLDQDDMTLALELAQMSNSPLPTEDNAIYPDLVEFNHVASTLLSLVHSQARRIATLHLQLHGLEWPTRSKLLKNVAAILQVPLASRSVNQVEKALSDQERLLNRTKEKGWRCVIANRTARWHLSAKLALVHKGRGILSRKVSHLKSKFQGHTHCTGWNLALDHNFRATVSSGCCLFPRPNNYTPEYEERLDIRTAKDIVRNSVIPQAKANLQTDPAPTPFINMTDHTLPPEAERVISRGLTFIPPAKVDDKVKLDLEADAAAFANKLAWKFFWSENPESPDQQRKKAEKRQQWPAPYRPSSSRGAPLPENSPFFEMKPGIEEMAETARVLPLLQGHKKELRGFKVLKDIAREQENIFVEADKGAGILMMKMATYKSRVQGEILADGDTYERIPEDPLADLNKNFSALLSRLVSEEKIESEEASLILAKSTCLPRMFALVKLHKAGHPLRPVVSYVGSPLALSGKLLDNFLKPMVSSTSKYLQDSRHALEIIDRLEARYKEAGTEFKNIYTVSFDLVNFYPSVDHQLAMEAVEKAVTSVNIDEGHQSALIQLLKFQLDNAFFGFDGQFFRQKTGLPIGSAIGGPVACLALAQKEEELSHQILTCHPDLEEIWRNFFRYLDDSFSIFTADSPQKAQELVEKLNNLLNNLHPCFSTTCTGATKTLALLDIKFSIGEENFNTTRFQKPTDKRTLLHFTSNHPVHIKRAIPYGVALRMRRLCNTEPAFWANLIDEAKILLARGYPEEIIIGGFARAIIRPREEVISKQKKTGAETSAARFIHTFDRNLEVAPFFEKLKECWHALRNAPCNAIYRDIEIQRVTRNLPNLRRAILYKDGPQHRVTFQGFRTCPPGPKCKFCDRVGRGMTFTTPPSILGLDITLPTASCKTTNVVYLCGCTYCGATYIGQTGGEIKVRGNRHAVQDTDQPTRIQDSWTEPRKHYVTQCHRKNFWVAPIHLMRPGASQNDREKVEARLIKKYRPNLNLALPPPTATRRPTLGISRQADNLIQLVPPPPPPMMTRNRLRRQEPT